MNPDINLEMLDYPTAWIIQKGYVRELSHHQQCSSVPGRHPMSGPGFLCDCGAVVRKWEQIVKKDKRMKISKQVVDQAAHFTTAIATLSLVLQFPGVITAALTGATIGLVRELTEAGATVTWAALRSVVASHGSRIDIAFWTLGGAMAGFLFA